MSTHPRLSSSPVRTGQNAVSRRVRRGPLSAVLLAGIALLLAVLAAPAGAVVTEVGASAVGAQPRNAEKVLFGEGALAESFNNPTGNPVLHSTKTYSIFWDPTNNYHSDWMNLINTFFHDFGSDSGSSNLSTVFSVDTQYTDRTNQPASYASTFEGSYHDTNAYPTSGGCTDPNPPALPDRVVINKTHTIVCLTDKQVQEEVKHMIAQHALPTGMGTVYYLLTPPSITVCLDAGGPTGHCSDYAGSSGETSYKQSFCSYHSAVNPGKLATGDTNTVLYAAIPWTAGGLGYGKLTAQTPAYDCQDGGFDAGNTKELEPIEKQKVKSKKEEEAFKEKNQEEQEAQEVAEALEGQHQQEPNQGGCPSEDGFCDHGLADLIINQVAVEQQNTVTNPLLNAWQDSARNEATDECRNFFALATGSVTADPKSGAGTLFNQSINGGTYYLNNAFNAAATRLSFPGVPCLHGVNLVPRFTAPNPVNAGELVGLNGMESLVDLNSTVGYPVSGEGKVTYATYSWNFGDGTPVVSGFAPGSPSQNTPEITQCEAPWIAPCAGSVIHSYQYGGTYDATLTIHDTGGHTASVTKSITVDGPARPIPAPEPAPAPAPPAPGVTTDGSGKSGSGGSGGGTSGSHAKPVATQAVTSHSLASVLRRGLVINYSVNEQVAGRFEVLLASSIARRIGLHGPAATGLAKGTAAQMVIAKAVLVTTKGGHSTYKIKFSKATAAHLRKLKKVSLMIRLVVHNASSPVVTTVLNTVNLSH